MKLIITWHHIVLEETARGLSDALTIMGMDHEYIHSKSRMIDDDENIYIIVGVHHFEKFPLNYIVIQTEQPGSNWITPSLFNKFDMSMGLWEFSPKLNKEWVDMGYNSYYVPIRIPMNLFVDFGEDDSVHFKNVKQDIDVLFYGGKHNRRVIMENKIKKFLPMKKILFRYYDLFGEEREEIIARSKIVINMHFWPKSSLETHRIEYLMARGKCVVSENSMDEDLDEEYSKAVKFTKYSHMEETLKHLLNNPEEITKYETLARRLSEKHQFNMENVKKALLGCYKNIQIIENKK